MTFFWALLFVSAVLVFWSLNLLGLPGNWMIVAATVLYAWLTSTPGSGGLRWTAVAIVAGLAVFGEVVELAASAAGVKRVGGSRRGAVLALIGSVAGAMTGLFVGVPIPVIGSVIAALLFAGLGALLGGMLGELTAGRSLANSWRVGRAAFWGRLFGTLAKTLIGAMMAGVAISVVVL
ncbi:MAG TPA: DUF456 domain-containing protein [Gemmataceae bacterium]|nr:DUF456 domain-containing protein [Gemmataceae bacterium]